MKSCFESMLQRERNETYMYFFYFLNAVLNRERSQYRSRKNMDRCQILWHGCGSEMWRFRKKDLFCSFQLDLFMNPDKLALMKNRLFYVKIKPNLSNATSDRWKVDYMLFIKRSVLFISYLANPFLSLVDIRPLVQWRLLRETTKSSTASITLRVTIYNFWKAAA